MGQQDACKGTCGSRKGSCSLPPGFDRGLLRMQWSLLFAHTSVGYLGSEPHLAAGKNGVCQIPRSFLCPASSRVPFLALQPFLAEGQIHYHASSKGFPSPCTFLFPPEAGRAPATQLFTEAAPVITRFFGKFSNAPLSAQH